MMIGFIKPIIVLPDVEFSDSELDIIIAHELVHYRRKDVWLKFVMLIACAVHWFNPAVHFLGRHLSAQCELSCDEKVAMEMDAQERRHYGETILLMLQHGSAQRNLVCAGGQSNSKKNIKRRLLNMLNAKKIRKSMVVLSFVVALMITSIGGLVAYEFRAAASSRMQSDIDAAGISAATNTLNSGSVVTVSEEIDGAVIQQRLTISRYNEFWHSLPQRQIFCPDAYGFESGNAAPHRP